MRVSTRAGSDEAGKSRFIWTEKEVPGGSKEDYRPQTYGGSEDFCAQVDSSQIHRAQVDRSEEVDRA